MENDAHFMRELEELVMDAQKSFHISTSSALKEDRYHLQKMYLAFSSSYQTLATEMLNDIETLEKVLQSAAHQSGDSFQAYYDLLQRLKACYNRCSMEEAMKAVKNCQLTEAQQIFNDILGVMKGELLEVRATFSDYLQSLNLTAPYVSQTTTPDPDPNVHQQPGSSPVVIKKFRPKFDLLNLRSGSLKYAPVFITKAIQPGEIYIRFDDEDVPRYNQMQRELQKEFCSATRLSASYCSSPISGNAYAFQLNKDHPWVRVMLETYCYDGRKVFLVDSGLRFNLKPNMTFHELPDRFMELPAQAIRCHLHSLYRKDGKRFESPEKLPKIFRFMARYDGLPAVAFFHTWSGNDVGYINRPTKSITNNDSHELRAFVVLYPKGETNSINLQVSQNPSLGYLLCNENLQRKTHFKIREILLATQRSNQPICLTIKEKNELLRRNDDGEKMMTFQVANFFECQSPESIIFHTEYFKEEFVRIQNELNNFYVNRQSYDEEPINFDVGFRCAIFCENSWYRAEVIDVESYPEIVVSLLDTGFTLYANASKIRRLPDILGRVPRTVLRCSLSGLYSPCGMGCWDESTIDYIKKRLQRAERITIAWKRDLTLSTEKVVPVTVYVYDEMHQDSSPIGGNLNKELIQLGLAITTGNSLSLIKSSWKSLELPKVGETFTARATWFNEKGEIFLQNVRSKPELDYIRKYLHEKYENTRSTTSDLIFSPGDLCIVKFKNDWFRCTIRAIRGKEIEVYFADFGIVDVVDISDIRLDIALEEKPVQVLRCSLWNQQKLSACCNTSIWCAAVEHNVMFQEEAVEGELAVTVKAAGPPLQVELLYKSD